MKIVIFGASGRTGLLLVEYALSKGYQVIAYIRRSRSLTLAHPNLTKVVGQLDNLEKLKEAIAGSDACISTLGGGSLTKHSPEIIKGIDNIVTIMEQEGVNRMIYLSSIGAGDSRWFMPLPLRILIADIFLRVPLADHTANEKRIAKSKLQWTVVRPGGLNDDLISEILTHGSEATKLKGSPSISRTNVAAFILQQLTDSEYVNKNVWLYE
ncbi:MAG: NAD(P)-binding oxidoreductase [Paludibacter sp.]